MAEIEPSSAVSRLGQIFSPDRPVDDPDALFGRNQQLRELLISLGSTHRGVPILVGPPGIGKTSILRFAQQVLVGYPDVLESLDLLQCAPEPVDRLVIMLRCDSSMKSADDLSASIMEHIGRAFREPPHIKKFSIKRFDLEGTSPFAKGAASWERVESPITSPYSDLVQRISALRRDRAVGEIIFILDECEQLPWLDTLLDYTRDFDDHGCRFILAVRDHAADGVANPARGDYRWPDWIELPRLKRPDIRALYERAEKQLASLHLNWSITSEAVGYIDRHSAGEPWYLQMIGHELIYDDSLRLETRLAGDTSEERLSVRVGLNEVRRAEAQMLKSRLRGLHRARYVSLTAGAPKREEMLRAFAHFPDTLIPVDFVSHVRRRRIGSASHILGALSQAKDAPIVHVKGMTAYQFSDHQFRVYCRLSRATSDAIDDFAKRHVESFLVDDR